MDPYDDTDLIALARARVHDPELLLLDEPFTGLEVRSAERLRDQLVAFHERGRSLVWTTHELDSAALADEAVALDRGRVCHRARGDGLRGEVLRPALERAFEGTA